MDGIYLLQAGFTVAYINITAAWAVDRGFVYIVGSLWGALGVPLGSLLLPLGCPWAPFGSLWLPLGALWPPLGSLWLPLGCLGVPCGSFPEFLEMWTSFSEQMCRFHDTVVQNQASQNSSADSPDSVLIRGFPGFPGSGPSRACRALGSTRAGGKDDGS